MLQINDEIEFIRPDDCGNTGEIPIGYITKITKIESLYVYCTNSDGRVTRHGNVILDELNFSPWCKLKYRYQPLKSYNRLTYL